MSIRNARTFSFLVAGSIWARLGPEFFLGERDVALADFGAVYLGKHRVGVFSPNRQSGEQDDRETAGGSAGEAGTEAEFRVR